MGKLIVFEGVDGSGKSTLCKAVASALAERGEAPALVMAFPSHKGVAGKLVRQAFTDPSIIEKSALMWVLMADAVDQEPLIRKALAAGHVLLDRHTQYSALAYQSPMHGLGMVDNVTPYDYFQEPDAVFVVDVPPEVAIARMLAREATGVPRNKIFEKHDVEYLEEQRDLYLNVVAAEEEIVHVLDGELSIAENVRLVLSIMEVAPVLVENG